MAIVSFHYQAFFQYLQSELGENINLAAWLGELLGLQPSSIYKRLRGKIPLSVPELLTITAACPRAALHASNLFKPQPLRVFQVNQFKNAQEFEGYLEIVLKLFQAKFKESDFHLNYVARDWPVFYFLSHPTVLRYKLSVWTGQPLGDGLLRISSNLEAKAKDLWSLYREISSTELWEEGNSQRQFTLLDIDLNNGVISQSLADEIKAVYTSLIAQLRKAVSIRQKSLGGVFKLYSTPAVTLNNGGLMTAGEELTLLGSLYNAQHFECSDPEIVEQFQRNWNRHIQSANEVTGSSPAHQEHFLAGQLQRSLPQSA